MPRLRRAVEQILPKLREAELALSKREPASMDCLQNPVRSRPVRCYLQDGHVTVEKLAITKSRRFT